MEICTCQYKTSMTICKYDTNDPNVKEKLQSSQTLRCGLSQWWRGWAKESFGIKKMIVFVRMFDCVM